MISACVCGAEKFVEGSYNNLSMRECVECGVLHQKVDMTKEEYIRFYQEEYYEKFYTHTLEQDLDAAAQRVESYKYYLKGKILDAGCGNGAFVQVLKAAGYDVVGCDVISSKENHIYEGTLETIMFPSGYFNLVTCHDVLEHIVDVNSFLREVNRILTFEGVFIIDFPQFFENSGTHHWKDKEHLWMLNDLQMRRLLSENYFSVEAVKYPVPGKITYTCSVKRPKKTKILIPPGIGDTYWVLCKLQSFCDKRGIGVPEVHITTTRADRNRSIDFVKRFPFVEVKGYYPHSMKGDPIWRKVYMEDGDGMIEKVHGFDWFLSANGAFRFGKTLDDIMPEYATNWYPPMFVDKEEHKYGKHLQKLYGNYVMCFFTDHGVYQRWLREFSQECIAEALREIQKKLGVRLILTGAKWDRNNINEYLSRNVTGIVNLVGQTDITHLIGLMRYSTGCIGFAAGNTIFSTVLKKPTIIIWNDYFDERFHSNSCPPDSLHGWYTPLNTSNLSADLLTERFCELWKTQS